MISTLEAILRLSFTPLHLQIEDESSKHAGHAGARSGGGHYLVTIVSEQFKGKTRVEQHRLVYSVLQDFWGSEIHALALHTYTPSQWENCRRSLPR